MLGKIALHLIGDEVDQFVTIEDSVEQERAVVAQTTGHVIHVQVCLYVASHKVRCIHLVSTVDRLVAEAQVRARETSRLLRVVGEVGLAILVGVVTDNLNGVLVGTHSTI